MSSDLSGVIFLFLLLFLLTNDWVIGDVLSATANSFGRSALLLVFLLLLLTHFLIEWSETHYRRIKLFNLLISINFTSKLSSSVHHNGLLKDVFVAILATCWEVKIEIKPFLDLINYVRGLVDVNDPIVIQITVDFDIITNEDLHPSIFLLESIVSQLNVIVK